MKLQFPQIKDTKPTHIDLLKQFDCSKLWLTNPLNSQMIKMYNVGNTMYRHHWPRWDLMKTNRNYYPLTPAFHHITDDRKPNYQSYGALGLIFLNFYRLRIYRVCLLKQIAQWHLSYVQIYSWTWLTLTPAGPGRPFSPFIPITPLEP